ncbi:hypothetical protein SDC9_168921 [bioreactor metagenome]|uniref:Uncharacterized protein n=1 Tax=bioreactor metagenome TaxID=1076179 RepID=A0A645G3U5_9ZZZZ
MGLALSNSHRHRRGDLPVQGIGCDDSQRSNDQIGIPCCNHNRILPRGDPVGTTAQHGARCKAVGSDGQYLYVFESLLYRFDQAFPEAATLTVDDYDLHAPPSISNRSKPTR